MADIAVVQGALNTGTGTQTFSSSESWTPVAALFFGSYGTVAGTAVDHAMFFVGATDGTRNRGMTFASEDVGVVANTDTGAVVSTSTAVMTQLAADQTQDASAVFSAWTAGGVTINITDAPPAAYLMTVVLFGPGAVSNAYVDNNITPSVIDTATDITTVGFLADLVIGWGYSQNSASNRPQVGFATSDNVQKGAAWNDTNNVATSDIRAHVSSTYIMPSAASSAAIEFRDFDSSGFSAFLRGVNGTAYNFHYLALKFQAGVSAKVVTSASPIVTGAHSITGAGWTPQFGLMAHTSAPTVDTTTTSDDAEVFGLSAFTAAGSSCIAVFSEDGTGTPDAECITDTKPVRLRKDHLDFMVATFTAFNSDGAEFNYSTADGTARQRAVLFIKALTGSSLHKRGGLPYMKLTNRPGW